MTHLPIRSAGPLALAFVLSLAACTPSVHGASSPPAPALTPAQKAAADTAAAARTATGNSIEAARAAFRRNAEPAVTAALAAARSSAGTNADLLDSVALADAGLRVERGDLPGAASLVLERLHAAERAHRVNEVNLHDRLIFIEEAQGDYLAAYLEAVEMRSALEREPPPWSARDRQGNYWQRAHTLRRLAATLKGDARTSALLYAREARDEFEALARQSGHALESIVLLDEERAALDGRCDEALKLAHSLKVEDLDPQDLYTTSFVFQTCGDDATARALRQRIAANAELDLFHAVYRYMARRADEASPPSAARAPGAAP